MPLSRSPYPCNVQWAPRLDLQSPGNGEGGVGTLSELFCYSSFCMSKPGRDGTKLPGSPLLGTIDNLSLLHGEFPESMGTQCLPKSIHYFVLHTGSLTSQGTGSFETLLTSNVPTGHLGLTQAPGMGSSALGAQYIETSARLH